MTSNSSLKLKFSKNSVPNIINLIENIIKKENVF